jgi:hypothetical protein
MAIGSSELTEVDFGLYNFCACTIFLSKLAHDNEPRPRSRGLTKASYRFGHYSAVHTNFVE